MTDESYPLCKRAGLDIWKNAMVTVDSNLGFCDSMIKASDLEALLSSAQVVYGHETGTCTKWYKDDVVDASVGAKQSAKILLIEPIEKPDTAEEILRGLVEYNYIPHGNYDLKFHTLVERARKLLENT